MKTGLKFKILKKLYYRFNLEEDKANEDEIVEQLKRHVEFKGTNLWTLFFAILIASIGLNVNSTAVIIGAMLISPLMGPIMGLGLGAGTFDFKLIKFSLNNLGIAALISIGASAIYFAVTPLQHAQSELLARTTPTLWDVLIALFGGLAGIIASSRKNMSNTIPGVAIATALMPPLCTAGYGLGTGQFYYFLGAFYLFLINTVFISIATFLMVRFFKFKPVAQVNQTTARKVKQYIWMIAILTILPSLFLAYKFVDNEIFKQSLTNFVRHELEVRHIYILGERTKPLKKESTILVSSEQQADTIRALITKYEKIYSLTEGKIVVEYTSDQSAIDKDLITRNDLLQFQQQQQAQLITKLQLSTDSIRHLLPGKTIQDSTFLKEFNVLFGAPQQLTISRVTPIYPKSSRRLLLCYIKKNQALPAIKIKKWLSARYPEEDIKVLIE